MLRTTSATKTLTSLAGLLLAVGSGCIAQPSLEQAKEDLSPQVCEPVAQNKYSTCIESCDEALETADDALGECISDVGSDLQQSLADMDRAIAAFNVAECQEPFDLSQCESARARVKEWAEQEARDHGTRIDPRQAGDFADIACETILRAARAICYITEVPDAANATWPAIKRTFGLEWGEAFARTGVCLAVRGVAWVEHETCVGLVPRTGCDLERANSYANCRGECLGRPGTACVPAGYPAWIDCGTWSSWAATDVIGSINTQGVTACDCRSNVFQAPQCAQYLWAKNMPFLGDRTLGTACRAAGNKPGQMTFVVTKDADGHPTGHETRCVELDQYGAPNVPGLRPAVNPTGGNDSCQFANDGVCDEPRHCGYGTDMSDCGYSSTTARAPSQTPAQPPSQTPAQPPSQTPAQPTAPTPSPETRPAPTTTGPEEAVREYYMSLGRGDADGVVSAWKNPARPEYLRSLVNGAQWYNIDSLTSNRCAGCTGPSATVGSVHIDVTGRHRGTVARRWVGDIRLEKVAGVWKITGMRLHEEPAQYQSLPDH